MDKKDDLRVIKTKKILYETLIELMKTKTFEEIKVSDICTKALINRSTFYAHYEDKYELLLEFINSLKEEFINELSKNKNILNTREYYLEMIRLFLDHIENKKDIYNAIMINNRNSIMMDILSSVANNEVIKKMESSNISTKVPANIIAKFYLGGVLNLGIEWLRDTNKNSKEEIIKYLEILLPENIE
ncbi:transcriptional regulator TetR family [Firmicutes bacterium CAG:884]|nr:transcriptional regulator TetR family [Firmicutes bacterium CAG:884]